MIFINHKVYLHTEINYIEKSNFEGSFNMKYSSTVISVADINSARKFYEDLFGLEVFQDYGKNIAFTCGLALQQDFNWLVGLSKDDILNKSNNMEICFEEQTSMIS